MVTIEDLGFGQMEDPGFGEIPNPGFGEMPSVGILGEMQAPGAIAS